MLIKSKQGINQKKPGTTNNFYCLFCGQQGDFKWNSPFGLQERVTLFKERNSSACVSGCPRSLRPAFLSPSSNSGTMWNTFLPPWFLSRKETFLSPDFRAQEMNVNSSTRERDIVWEVGIACGLSSASSAFALRWLPGFTWVKTFNWPGLWIPKALLGGRRNHRKCRLALVLHFLIL